MPLKTIIYWRDLPAQVIVKSGRQAAKRQLPERFEQAIDIAAMRAGLRDSDAYLGEMRRSAPEEVAGEDLEALADAAAEALEAEFTPERLKRYIANGGWAEPRG